MNWKLKSAGLLINVAKMLSKIKNYFSFQFLGIFMLMFLSTNSICQPLTGVYTIGGDIPDFTTIGEAIDDLAAYGISSDVTFNIRNGIYEEKLILPEISGASESSRIVFQSEIGHWDSVKVTFYTFLDYSENYVWLLDGADFITLKDISLINSDASYSTTLRISGNSNNNEFLGVKFDGRDGDSFSSNTLIGIRAPCNFSNTLFEDCYFIDGSANIHGSGDIAATNFRVIGCMFDIGKMAGINLENLSNPTLVNNTFRCVPSCYAAGQKAVTLNSTSGIVNISYNNIDLNKGAGIIVNGIDDGIDNLQVVNNHIGSSQIYGVDAVQFRNVNAGIFAQNTINVMYNAAYFDNCSNVDILNNIFKSGAYRAINYVDCFELNSNNNCFYGKLYSDGVLAEDLTEFQMLTGTDEFSIYYSPLMLGTPYAYSTDDYFLHNTGAELVFPTDDIHEFTRDALPDIGALEFNLPELEAFLFGIGEGGSESCSGWYPIKAEIINMGIENITSLSFEIYFNEEIYSSFEWTGLISTGDTLVTEVLDSILLISGTEQSVLLSITAVNGVDDAHEVNNNFGYTDLKVALSGDYTVGNILSDYESLAEAMSDLNEFGTCGNVRFLLNNGEYTGGIYLNDFYQSNPVDTVTIESLNLDASLVTISSTSSSVFRLNGLDNFIFKNVSLKSTGAISVIVSENTNMLGIYSSDLIGTTSTIYYYADDNLTAKAKATIKATNTNIIDINNCNIENGSSGLFFQSGVKAFISESNFTNFKVSAINAHIIDSLSVLNNTINGKYIEYYYHISYGIRVDSAITDVIIRDNEIAIYNGRAFGLHNCPDAVIKIWNNAARSTINSVIINGCSNVELIHNSFHLYSFGLLSTESVLNLTDVSGLNVKNNLFKHSGGGDFLNILPESSEFNYNSIFLSDGLFSPAHTDFIAWQADGNGLNSHNINAPYLSDSLLHIASAPAFTGTGLSFPLIHEDLEQKHRFFPPDIGAYNIGQDTTDIELLSIVSPYGCDSLMGLIIDIANNGPDTLYSLNIYFTLNEILDSVKYSSVIFPGETEENIWVKDLVLEATEDYDIEVWCETELWNIDSDLSNNSSETSVIGPYMKGIYTIGGVEPDFNTLYDAIERLKISGICGDVILEVRKGVYGESIICTEIPGLSDTNSLLIQGAEILPDSVMITGSLFLKNIENVTIKNLHFYRGTGNLGMGDTCQNITIRNNKFRSLSVSLGSNIGFGGSADDYYDGIKIIENDLGASDNIYCYGSYATLKNFEICDNDFTSSKESMMTLIKCENLKITGNENRNPSFPEYQMFLFKNITGSINISNNNFYLSSAEFYNMDGTEDNPAMIRNNIWGSCEFLYSEHIEFLQNTVSACPPEEPCSDEPLSLGGGNSFIKITNNIFNLVILGGGRKLISIPEYYHVSPDIQCDHNLFYAEPQPPYFDDRYDEEIFESAGDASYSFINWQENTPYDAFSNWGDPQFISRENAHLNQDNIFPFSSEISLDSVANDIDGELRNELTPLYGADEYIPHNSNSSIFTVLVPNQCGTLKEVSVNLVNTGTENLTSSIINWTINDSLVSPVLWSGDLEPEDTAIVYLGEYDLGIQNAAFVTSWSEMPNGVEDPFTIFDTAHFVLKKRYAGHYTAYGEEPDFPDLQSAIDSLAFYGICDSIFLNIRSGAYSTNITIPYIEGASDSSWITIQSEDFDSSMVLFEAGISRYTFTIDSAQYIQIRHLSIKRSDGILTKGCIAIKNQSSNISINNNHIWQPASLDSWHGIIQIGYQPEFEIDNQIHSIDISNNLFNSNDAMVIRIRGASFASEEFIDHDLQPIKGITIKNNKFFAFPTVGWGMAEGLITMDFIQKPIIVGNTFFSNKDRAIQLNNFTDTLFLTHNSFHSTGANGVVRIKQGYGLLFDNNYSFIGNNEFSLIGWEFGMTGTAISAESILDGQISNNSILSLNTYYPNLAINNSDCEVINNQIICFGESYPYRLLGDLGSNFDYNNYYSENKIAIIGGALVYDLSTLMSDYGLDSNSIWGNPEFVNDTSLISTNLINVDQGATVDFIIDDILGNTRVYAYDIGAYELDDYDLNLTILAIKAVPFACGDSLDIFIDFKNSGIVDINNFDISLEGDGILPSSFEWLGTLEHFEVVNDYFLMTSSAIEVPTDISVILSDPNDDLDEYLLDNGLVLAFEYFYADSIISHYFEICEGDSVLLGDTYIFMEGIYNETLLSNEGCDSLVEVTVELITVNTNIHYEADTLTALEDGVAYQWVNCETGYSHIEDEIYQDFTPSVNGNYAVIIEQFGCSDTSDCYSVFDVGLQTEDFSKLKIYPNPTTDKIWLDFGSQQSDILINLYSSDGKLIYSETHQFIKKIVLDLDVAAGIYFLNIKNLEGESRLFKVLKQ